MKPTPVPAEQAHDGGRTKAPAPFAVAIGHTRFVVLVGVFAVLLIAATLFLLGAAFAVMSVWRAVHGTVTGQLGSTDLTVQFLEIVSVMLKAVFFYLIGIGLYSLFIAPLNLPAALGVETLNDLETKIISVIVVIMAVTFLEHFIQWQQPTEILYFGVALALVVAALVLFQWHTQQTKEEQTRNTPAIEERAQVQLFTEGKEQRDLDYEQAVAREQAPDGAGPRWGGGGGEPGA